MKIKVLLISLCVLALSACGDGSTEPDSNDSIGFTILLSANCDGTLGSAQIFFDDRQIATLTPGGSTSVVTTRGEHRIEARGDNGGSVGPITRNLQVDGSSETLTCDN